MTVLALSGIPVPTAGSFSYAPTLLGEKRRTWSGLPVSSVRRKVETVTASTPLLTLAEATVLRALIDGDGHSWSFDTSTTSSRGAVPASTLGTVAVTAGGAKYGAGRLVLGVTSQASWPSLAVDETATYALWAKTPNLNGGAWTHLVVYVDAGSSGDPPATVYVDGVAGAYADMLELEQETGLVLSRTGEGLYVALSSEAGGSSLPPETTLEVDDLVWLPYRVPTSWLAAWRDSGAAFGPLPHHAATGTGLRKAMQVLGDAKQGRSEEGTDPEDGVLKFFEAFEFELLEVPE